VGSNGTAVLVALAQLVLSFYGVVILFIVVVMGLIAKLAGFSLWRFLRYIKDEIFIVLGTASSESALPRLLIKLERLGCAKQTVGLVLPTGYAFNLDGTSLFMSMGVMFIAHAYGVPITLEHQIGILLLMLLTSKGAATVSGGSFVVFAATVTSTGILPVEGWRSSSACTASCRWRSRPATRSATASPRSSSRSGRARSTRSVAERHFIRSAIRTPHGPMSVLPTATAARRHERRESAPCRDSFEKRRQHTVIRLTDRPRALFPIVSAALLRWPTQGNGIETVFGRSVWPNGVRLTIDRDSRRRAQWHA
jgi:hypothetical protein